MKKIFLFALCVLLGLGVQAEQRTQQEAAAIAAQFTNNQPQLSRMHRAPRTASTMTLAHKVNKLNQQEVAYYVFNQENQNGYVIVSADDRTEDVLVYSEKGSFDANHVNPNLQFWLNRLQEEISAANDENAVDKSSARKATQVEAISPLLVNDKGEEITWYQETPYNNLLPTDNYDRTTCLTGCVATAASQIMYKWQYPVHGTGTKKYTWQNANKPSQSYTFNIDYENTYYDWANMLPSYAGKSATSAQKTAVATLMRDAGVACDMDYGGDEAGGSGAWTDDMGEGLVKYFGYKVEKFIITESKQNYQSSKGTLADLEMEFSCSISTFEAYFNADLEAGRPILMGGEDRDGGHEFVCDGRNSSGYFHINWGWEGDGNNYVRLSALKPSGSSYNFSNVIDALIGLEPANLEPVNVESISVSPTSKTLKQNERFQITATILPKNATNKKVTWTSSKPAVASVDNTGKVTALTEGETTITVTTADGNHTASCAISVSSEVIESKGFTLVTDASDLAEGDELIIVCTDKKKAATDIDSQVMGEADVTISDNTIELDEESEVVVLTLGGKSGAWTLTNSESKLLGATAVKKLAWNSGTTTWDITISNNNATIQSTNSSYGRFLYNVGSPRFTTYTSTPSATMLLPQIYARQAGTPTPVGPVSVTGVELSQTTLKLEKGATATLTAQVQPKNADDQEVNWASDNIAVATVINGKVSAVGEGQTTIIVTTHDGNFTASCTVTVTDTGGGSEEEEETDADGDYQLITSTAELQAGSYYLIANAYEGTCAVMGEQNTNNRNAVTGISIHNGNIQKTEDMQAVMLKGEEDQWELVVEDGYLYAGSSSKNYLKTSDELNSNGLWAITFSGKAADIEAQGTNTHNILRYNPNNGSPLFSCYATGQNAVYLYRHIKKVIPTDDIQLQENATESVQKVLIDGRLIIIREGKQYSVTGSRL